MYLNESLTAQELAEQAKSLLDRDRAGDAVEMLQKISRKRQSKLMQQTDDLYVDATIRVRSILRSDRRLLEAYRKKYSAQAQRQLGLARKNGPDIQRLERVFNHYRLTASGLDAGLDLAGFYLVRAQPGAALGVLDQLADHPDFETQKGRFHLLRADASLVRGGASQQVAASRKALKMIGDRKGLKRIERLEASLKRSVIEPEVSNTEAGEADGSTSRTTDNAGREDLASVALANEPLWSMRFASPLAGPGVRSRRGQPLRPLKGQTRLNVLPKVAGDDLFLNAGDRLLALDVDSGRPLWQFNVKRRSQPPTRRSVIASRMSRLIGDKRSVLIQPGGQRLFAVVGKLTTTPIRMNRTQGGSTTSLVALDRTNGSVHWQLKPREIDPSLQNANFRGTPVNGYGQIFVLLTRIRNGGSRDTFVAAIDSNSGKPRWHRHIAGARASRRYSIGPSPTMIRAAGRIYVSDSLGAVAAIDPRAGTIRWVRLLADSQSVDRRMVRALGGSSSGPPDVGPPALVRAGLIVPLGQTGAPVTLVDPQTGSLREQFTTKPWTGQRIFDTLNGDLIAMGKTTTRYDGQSLEPRWQTTLTDDGPAPSDSESDSDSDSDDESGPQSKLNPLGRPALNRKRIVIPANKRVFVFNAKTGQRLERIETDGPAHSALHEDALLLAGQLDLTQLRHWDQARKSLTARIEANPLNPEPGLSLAYLGLTAKRAEQADGKQPAIEGVDAAIESLDRRSANLAVDPAKDPLRREVFTQLRTFVDLSFDVPLQTRKAMFERLAVVTTTPAEEVAYHLAYARFLRQEKVGRYAQAVEHYQAVLSTPTLANQNYQADGVTLQAGVEARRKLASLVERQGREVYKTYENLARSRLQSLQRGGMGGVGGIGKPGREGGGKGGKAQAYIHLAQRFPLANSAAEARYRAALALIDQGEATGAIGQFRRAYHQAQTKPLQAKIVGRLTGLYEDQNQPAKARRWLERIQRKSPQLRPLREGTPTTLASWLGDLAQAQARAEQPPRLTLPLHKPRVIEGTWVPPSPRTVAQHSDKRFLVRERSTVRLYERGTDQPVWSRQLWGAPRGAGSEAASGGAGQSPDQHADVGDDQPGQADADQGAAQRLRVVLGPGRQARQLRPLPRRADPGFTHQLNAKANPDRPLQTLTVTPGQTVLWAPGRKRLFGLNTRTGESIWPTRSAPAMLKEVTVADRLEGEAGAVDKEIMDMIGAQADGPEQPVAEKTFVAAGETVICLADRRGRVVGIDQYTGEVLWRVRSPINRLKQLAVSGSLVALAGKAIGASDDFSARLLVLDLITGEPRFNTVHLGNKAPAWMGLDRHGRLITAEDDALVARDTQTGQILWRQTVADSAWSGQGWIDDSALVLAERDQTLRFFDPATGKPRQSISASSSNPYRSIRITDGNLFLLRAEAATSLDAQGKRNWADAIHPPGVERIAQTLGRKHLFVIAQTPATQRRDADDQVDRPALMLYAIDRESGRLVEDYRLVMPTATDTTPPSEIKLIDNALLITEGNQTLLYPGSDQ